MFVAHFVERNHGRETFWAERLTLELLFRSTSLFWDFNGWRQWKISCPSQNQTLKLTTSQIQWVVEELINSQKIEIHTLDELGRCLKMKVWE